MCTGLELAALGSLGATAGGSYLQAESAEAKQDAEREQAMAELARQEAFDDERFANFQEALGMVGREQLESGQEEAAAGRSERMQEIVDPSGGEPAGSYGASRAMSVPKVVQQTGDRQRSESDDFVRSLGDARSRLGSWGDVMFDLGEGLGDVRQRQNRNMTRAGRSAQLGKLDAQQARENTGNRRALAGNLLSTAGQIGSLATGAAGGWGSLFGGGGAETVAAAGGAGGAPLGANAGNLMFQDPTFMQMLY